MKRRVFAVVFATAGLVLSAGQVRTVSAASSMAGHYRTIDDPNAGLGSGQGTVPSGINDAGVVVGNYYTSTSEGFGFRYEDGRFSPVNDPNAGTGAFQGTDPLAINSQGVIGGYYLDAGGVYHGFLFRHGAFTTLNDPHAGTSSGQGTIVQGTQ